MIATMWSSSSSDFQSGRMIEEASGAESAWINNVRGFLVLGESGKSYVFAADR
jgi:hypothetical protein